MDQREVNQTRNYKILWDKWKQNTAHEYSWDAVNAVSIGKINSW